ncbi:unnamed protein product [Bursaphelenchus okinawaensis]|uniref:Uncharacterized protein n=1 Tax=Bursaphelenchus okinawaensis TaxID=465554 RepID=A0A811KAG1_9BILA|nr:unnamed protein product [Bursaphelenchus okinawaensis]CAG9097412.1 unnamed protein product [Bursaphelenchus okinawaensis]
MGGVRSEKQNDSIEFIDTDIVASNDGAEIDGNGSTKFINASTKVFDDGTQDKSGNTTRRCTKRTECKKDQKRSFHRMYTLILGAELEKGNDEKVKDLKVLKPYVQNVLSKLLGAVAKNPGYMKIVDEQHKTLEHGIIYKYTVN